MRIWYVIADGARARIFEAKRRGDDICELEAYVNPKGRLVNRDIDTDRPGRSFKTGGRRTAMEGAGESPSEREEARFAKQIADRVNRAYQEEQFERLAIVAAPKALGRIRKHLKSRVENVVVGTSSKNLTKAKREQIQQHLDKNIG
jgi:protein required for attachment to host cells